MKTFIIGLLLMTSISALANNNDGIWKVDHVKCSRGGAFNLELGNELFGAIAGDQKSDNLIGSFLSKYEFSIDGKQLLLNIPNNCTEEVWRYKISKTGTTRFMEKIIKNPKCIIQDQSEKRISISRSGKSLEVIDFALSKDLSDLCEKKSSKLILVMKKI
jgi:hypothetical protein